MRNQTNDTRFDDPEYLAAKFVVFVANRMARYGNGTPLDFIGVGVTMLDADDGEYVYTVNCAVKEDGHPAVSYRKA